MRNSLNGILLLNKVKNCTSHDVVAELRKALDQQAVGHAGTLDPAAEGLLVMLLGQATKLSSYILNNNKRYFLKMKFGLVTDTFDTDGKVIQDNPVSLDKENIKKSIESFLGDLKIPVPIFSAVKIKGKKLYQYAQSNQTIELPQKEMSFFDLNIKEITKDEATLEVSCSKGSYIRSWVNSIGQSLGVGACLTYLKRVRSEPFSLEDAVTLEELKEKLSSFIPDSDLEFKKLLGSSFLLSHEALPQFPLIELTHRDSQTLSRGRIPQFVIQDTLETQKEANKTQSHKIIKVTRDQRLISLLEFRPFQKLRILKNFSNQNNGVRI